MTANEGGLPARIELDGQALRVDLSRGISLARSLDFGDASLRFFGAPAARSEPLIVGARYNCNTITLTPHCNGTHTESVGHLTTEPVDVHRIVPQRLVPALLLTVAIERAVDSAAEDSDPLPQARDWLVTRRALETAWPRTVRFRPEGLLIRARSQTGDFNTAGAVQPFLSRQAAQFLVAQGIEHVVLELPSVDRTEDQGKLTAHRIFFGLPPDSSRLADARRPQCTITELAIMDASIADGWFLLSLQTPAIAGDAVPSRPVIYAAQ